MALNLGRVSKLISGASKTAVRCMSYYPIDENIFGLSEEQQKVGTHSYHYLSNNKYINNNVIMSSYDESGQLLIYKFVKIENVFVGFKYELIRGSIKD